MTRMASMEQELAGYRSQRSQPQAVPAPQAPAFNPQQFLAAYVTDPVGTIARMGATQEQLQHVTQVHFAHALGDAAPPQFKMLAQMGPQVAATSQLASQISSLGQRLETFETGVKKQSTRDSFIAAVSDKTKYPHLAAAYAADPALFSDAIDGHRGNAVELADALETRHKKLAEIYGPKTPAASDETAGADDGQSKQAELATSPPVGIDPTPPPIQQPKQGVWSEADHDRTKAAILKKYGVTQ